MKFIVAEEIFEKLPNVCFGVVMARGIDNSMDYPEIDCLLDESIKRATQHFYGEKVKEEPDILPYREAFRILGINPNKYPCSIEAMFTRIAKGKEMPHINPVVDLGNAVSLKYTLPIGAHDLGSCREDICVRFAQPSDIFLPFGSNAEEMPDPGEAVYAVGHQVRTRRWTWRQSEQGKISTTSTDVFFPIDGFADLNQERVIAARDELQTLIDRIWGCKTTTGLINAEKSFMEL